MTPQELVERIERLGADANPNRWEKCVNAVHPLAFEHPPPTNMTSGHVEFSHVDGEIAALMLNNRTLIAAALRLAEGVLTIEDCCGTISESGCSRNNSAETDLQTLLPAYRAARESAK